MVKRHHGVCIHAPNSLYLIVYEMTIVGVWICPQREPTAHSGDCHPQHGWCRSVVPSAGDPHRCWNGEKDPRPRQEHKVRQSDTFKIYTVYVLHCTYCCYLSFPGPDKHLWLKGHLKQLTTLQCSAGCFMNDNVYRKLWIKHNCWSAAVDILNIFNVFFQWNGIVVKWCNT